MMIEWMDGKRKKNANTAEEEEVEKNLPSLSLCRFFFFFFFFKMDTYISNILLVNTNSKLENKKKTDR